MKKRLFTLLAALMLIGATLMGCGSSNTGGGDTAATNDTNTEAKADTESTGGSAGGGSIKIGIAMSEYNDKWLSYMLDAMKETAEGYTASEGIEFMYADGKNDINAQIGQVEDFINNGCNAIVIVPINTDATQQITDTCEAAGVKLIAVNRKPTSAITSYIGSESIVSGRLEMEYLAEKMGGKGKVAILIGQAGQEAATDRTQGFKEVIEKYPDIEIVAEEYGNWQRDKGMQIVETWIQGGIEFDAIASNNDEMAIGAILALKDAGRTDVLVGGIDATVDGLEYLKDGSLAVTVFQNAKGQGSESINVAVKAAKGETVEEINWIDYELVPPEKYDEYMARWE